jgi:hypothetical protein
MIFNDVIGEKEVTDMALLVNDVENSKFELFAANFICQKNPKY